MVLFVSESNALGEHDVAHAAVHAFENRAAAIVFVKEVVKGQHEGKHALAAIPTAKG